MPTITQLQYVVALDRTKHFGRAAGECHVTQPSLSSQIQKLEDELGFVVFDRSRKPILTTERGEAVVAQAKVVLREHDKLSHLGPQEGVLRGAFHLGVIPTLAPYVVPLFVDGFSKKYPEVELTVSEYKTEDIVAYLNEDRLDGGLLVTPLNDDGIIERSLFFEPFYAFVSNAHPLRESAVVKENELEAGSAWLLDEGHCFRDQVLKVCARSHAERVLNNVRFDSGSLETVINLVRRGTGYTLLPHLCAEQLPDSDRLNLLKPFEEPVPTREVSLVHARSFLKHEIIEALEREVLLSLPGALRSLKKGNVKVVPI